MPVAAMTVALPTATHRLRDKEAAQQIERAALDVFRHKALCRCGEPEIG